MVLESKKEIKLVLEESASLKNENLKMVLRQFYFKMSKFGKKLYIKI